MIPARIEFEAFRGAAISNQVGELATLLRFEAAENCADRVVILLCREVTRHLSIPKLSLVNIESIPRWPLIEPMRKIRQLGAVAAEPKIS